MLFGEFRKKKQKPKNSVTPASNVSQPDSLVPENIVKKIGQTSTEEDDFSGLELKSYAQKHVLTIDQVWERIRQGKLVARTENGFVYVYGSNFPQPSLAPTRIASASDKQQRPVPTNNVPAATLPAQVINVPMYPAPLELDALVTQLTEARSQQLEIMRLTQDAVMQMRQMAEQVAAAKDQIIGSKEAQLVEQSEEIARLKKNLEVARKDELGLRQELEDMEMLNRSLGIE